MSRRLEKNVIQIGESVVSSHSAVLAQSRSRFVGKLKPVKTVPGKCFSDSDALTKERSHSFAFSLDQTRKVSIDIVNQRKPSLLEELFRSRNIQAILWSECGNKKELFSTAPGERNRETITLKSGRYLLELKTNTGKKVHYALKLTPMKWLMLEYFAS